MTPSCPLVGTKAAELVDEYMWERSMGNMSRAEELSRRITALAGEILTKIGIPLSELAAQWERKAPPPSLAQFEFIRRLERCPDIESLPHGAASASTPGGAASASTPGGAASGGGRGSGGAAAAAARSSVAVPEPVASGGGKGSSSSEESVARGKSTAPMVSEHAKLLAELLKALHSHDNEEICAIISEDVNVAEALLSVLPIKHITSEHILTALVKCMQVGRPLGHLHAKAQKQVPLAEKIIVFLGAASKSLTEHPEIAASDIALAVVARDSAMFLMRDNPSNKKVALLAVRYSGRALKHASNTLRDDREVVLEAIKYHVSSLKFVSERLRGDRNIIIAALIQDESAIDDASGELKKSSIQRLLIKEAALIRERARKEKEGGAGGSEAKGK